MANILLIYKANRDQVTHGGVIKKMAGQKRGFEAFNHRTDTVSIGQEGVYFNDILELSWSYINWKMFRPAIEHYQFCIALKNILLKNSYDLLYVRYFYSSYYSVSLWRWVKQSYPNTKIVIELPTYPYEKESSGLKWHLTMTIDRLYRKKLHPFIDLITHFGDHVKIWNIPAFPINNGIDPEQFALKKNTESENRIRFLAVGTLWYWYGLDRMIKGISEYNNKIPVTLTIAGEGVEKTSLKKLIQKLGLENTVYLTGHLTGSALDDAFDHADIGIGVLGIHRKGLEKASALKHREFAARGLPFVYSGNDDDFDFMYFSKKTADDENPVDINDLVNWYIQLKNDKADVLREDIRLYAITSLTWKNIMQRILDELVLS